MTDALPHRLSKDAPGALAALTGGAPIASSSADRAHRRAAYATQSRGRRTTAALRWALAVFACLWLSLCTAVGPLFWEDEGIAQFSWLNAVFGLLAFAVYFLLIVALVRAGSRRRIVPASWHKRHISERRLAQSFAAMTGRSRPWALVLARSFGSASQAVKRLMFAITSRWWKIAAILFIGWLWVPATLLSAFGADIRSQIREFSWAYNQWTGLNQPYIGFFSFVPMDIYPTAHYMWPANPIYLTDQHNIVLTVLYGTAAAISRYFTGSNDWGLVALSAGQFLFAVFCCASAANRFLNLPWLGKSARPAPPSHFRQPERFQPRDLMRPERGMVCAHVAGASGISRASTAGAGVRTIILVFFLCCPLVLFSTISLTKSPVFAYAFVWWFGAGYELHMTRPATPAAKPGQGTSVIGLWPVRRHAARTSASARLFDGTRKRTAAALAASTCIMLVSAKYAFYILVVQILLLLIADRTRWRTYCAALVVPVVVVHGSLSFLIASGAVIGGDPIESRGIQLQQIARVAKLNPAGIPQQARDELAPVFNLDQMADSYFRQDADPVKSSGIQSKKVSYRWRTVTKGDMADFNRAWLAIVKANPRIALDAFLAKCFGYFDVADQPYVSMDYYLTSDYVTQWSSWIRYWQPHWRHSIARLARVWGAVPVLGWVTHGNLYVVLTLLLGAAEVVLRRWRTLVWHVPLLLLMGVFITSPANNFERHMLPVAFVFGFVALTFWRDSHSAGDSASS
ncbi:DUF6020 family protein [Bifidobacterium sp.]|jgi:hypothetical protein|uniref:DUF6020 family protein n=1 Tax=Bifidobacterium sp. TaxID=41200 RepID=UPI0025B8F10A|nr:DUF6020 family protein [Bifidobacterium sp.]MCH4209772.1 DUF6020 family protein [Bifidobacterium sp.]MCI1224563.1 DUF6020 family protein [Bifidobacterium sp.]